MTLTHQRLQRSRHSRVGAIEEELFDLEPD